MTQPPKLGTYKENSLPDCDGYPGDPQDGPKGLVPRFPDVTVKMVGEDGNAFAIMGRVSAALKEAGHGDVVDEYTAKSMSGDYDNLLRTAWEYVNVT